MENKYRSRKFIITVSGIALAFAAAYFGFLTPELSTVILTGMASYNITNAWIGRNGTS